MPDDSAKRYIARAQHAVAERVMLALTTVDPDTPMDDQLKGVASSLNVPVPDTTDILFEDALGAMVTDFAHGRMKAARALVYNARLEARNKGLNNLFELCLNTGKTAYAVQIKPEGEYLHGIDALNSRAPLFWKQSAFAESEMKHSKRLRREFTNFCKKHFPEDK